MHLRPIKPPNLTRKVPLTDRPTGLMAALETWLADRLPVRRVVRRDCRSRTSRRRLKRHPYAVARTLAWLGRFGRLACDYGHARSVLAGWS